MPKVVVRECPFTGKLVKDDGEYGVHLQAVRAQQQIDRRNQRLHREFDSHIRAAQESCTSIEDIQAWLNDNWPLLRDSWNALHLSLKNGHPYSGDLFSACTANFSFDRMRYDGNASNTHCAPRGKPENWGGKPGVPTGYPGFRGRIYIVFDNLVDPRAGNPFSDFLRYVGVHTGTGGGGGGRRQYEATVWLEDWPTMYTTIALAQLAGDDYVN